MQQWDSTFIKCYVISTFLGFNDVDIPVIRMSRFWSSVHSLPHPTEGLNTV